MSKLIPLPIAPSEARSNPGCVLVSLRVGQICGIQFPDRDRVGVIVYRSETNHIVTDLDDI